MKNTIPGMGTWTAPSGVRVQLTETTVTTDRATGGRVSPTEAASALACLLHELYTTDRNGFFVLWQQM